MFFDCHAGTCAGGNPSENFSKCSPDWQAGQAPDAARRRARPCRSAPAPIVVLLALLPFGFALLLLLLAPPEQFDVLDARAALAAGGCHALLEAVEAAPAWPGEARTQ